MKERATWNGHRLFCGCEVDFGEVMGEVGYTPEDVYDCCPKCGYFPWYYLNPADEPPNA